MADPIRLRVRLPASIGAVRNAWTDATALRHWLADHVEAEPGRYAFWGRHTPQGEKPRQRPLHLDDRTLRFSWELSGEETIVEVLLEEDAGSTVVTLSQTCFEGAYSGYPVGIALTVFWSLALGNLTDHLMDRPTTPKCDYTARDLRTEVAIGAPRDAVFGSLTASEEFSRWFGLPVEIEPYVGGSWTIRRGGPIGTVRALEPGRLLSLAEDSGISTWELEDHDGGTLLRLGLSGFDPGSPPYPGWTGWLSAVSSLRRYHELADWRPIWLDT
ncbi:hypothetical protein GCM10027176_25060 [Actinoallomurus bryophytorum]|uniref:Uncharacterized protein YndB with AHSA1/START domain n=1 Tax=Actinoallomurus bryophytorum TaxID=1490222 RepID=A0A543CNH0_9ACTN|nr:SRPBCC domain-containing protein [Actinoallomurus bryophytorum]TQL98510.1 uncharacterized protein YndB with AHSA1/START domain [Actinoallomurus bryophytorum]